MWAADSVAALVTGCLIVLFATDRLTVAGIAALVVTNRYSDDDKATWEVAT